MSRRRTSDGAYIVTVDELQVGDRLRFHGAGRVKWWPVLAIEELPKTRRITCGVGSTGQVLLDSRMRRTTLVARAPREDENAEGRAELQAAIRSMAVPA